MMSHGFKEVIQSPWAFQRLLSGHCIEMVFASSSHLEEDFWSLPRGQDEEAIGDPFWNKQLGFRPPRDSSLCDDYSLIPYTDSV